MSVRDYSTDPLELLRRAEDVPPPAGAQERIAALLAASASGAGAGLTLPGTPKAPLAHGTVRELARRFVGWSLLPLAVGIVIGASGQALVRSRYARQAPSVAVSVSLSSPSLHPSSWAQAPSPVLDDAATRIAVNPSVSAGPSARLPSKLVAGDLLAQERAILDRARQKLAMGEHERALQFLEQHARRFLHGKLSEEREAMGINVLVSLGRAEQAKARGAAFMKQFPSSLMLSSVKAALVANSSD